MDPFPLGRYSVARIGFGAMQLPGPGVFGPPRDRDEALAVLRRAVELGVDHIDTAQFYGPDVANELIREALHPYPENLALVSKVGGRRDDAGAWLPLAEPADLRRDIETNLLTLGVDQLAVVNLRLFESDGPDQLFDDQLSVMIQARDEGLIGGIGLSNISVSTYCTLWSAPRSLVCKTLSTSLTVNRLRCWKNVGRGESHLFRSSRWDPLSCSRIRCWVTSWCRTSPSDSGAPRLKSHWHGRSACHPMCCSFRVPRPCDTWRRTWTSPRSSSTRKAASS